MHVIITMAGHSRRFQAAGYAETKALLPCGDKKMIEHVIDMFDPSEDTFHVVLNKLQAQSYPDLVTWLSKLASRMFPIVIDPHDKGPVYSALLVPNIPPDAEVIISYCDFYVDWDYSRFLRQVHGVDGGIVSFRGFHPASFGKTFYAYMRAEGEEMLELKEKESFTEDRTSEHASAGIYFFGSWDIFKKYSSKLLEQEDKVLPEAYVSLLYNFMVEDGLRVVLHEAKHFICLGTPEDYEQYIFWWNYFQKQQVLSSDQGREEKRVAIVPMAGKGSRFKSYGYRLIKPLIPVLGVPMVLRSVNSFPVVDEWIFLPRFEDLDKHPVERALDTLNEKSNVLGVKHDTSGQAATCLLASNYLNDSDELLIASCDYEHRFSVKRWQEVLENTDIDGAIWTYRARGLPLNNPEAFAYCVVADDGLTVTKVVEKETISKLPELDPLVVGTFWFRKACDFKFAAKTLIEKDIRINNEHYVGTSINELIAIGKRFIIFDIDQWISFGDPFELKIMEYWQEVLDRRPSDF